MTLSFVAFAALLFAPTFASWSNTELETITACTTQYGSAKNTTEPWLDHMPIDIDTYTTFAWAHFSKTEVVTLRPSTTTISATSTSTSYLYPADNWTTTIYTSTEYEWEVPTQTESVTFTTTATVSQVETLTVPTLEGFVPVGSASPGAAKKTKSWDVPDSWDVQDVYWTTEPFTTERATWHDIHTDLLWRRGLPIGKPLKIACTVTIQSNQFYTTSYIKVSGPRATLTRTEIVATETSTFTVHTKPTAPPPTSVYTIEDIYWSTTSYTTKTVTVIKTATETVYPSTTSVLAACNTVNIVDSYNGYRLRDSPSWFRNEGNYTKQQIFGWDDESINSSEACCSRAVVDPKTIFWRYTGDWIEGCEIWKGDAKSCPAAPGTNGTSRSKVDVEVYYEPIADQGDWSSWDVGNGACGNIGFVSSWE